jgi:hypothetical protein
MPPHNHNERCLRNCNHDRRRTATRRIGLGSATVIACSGAMKAMWLRRISFLERHESRFASRGSSG